MRSETKGLLSIVFASLLFGTMGILVREISVHVAPFLQVLLRAIFAFLLLGVFSLNQKKHIITLFKKDSLLTIISGVIGYGLMLVLFTLAIVHTTIANAFFLLFIEPIFVIALAAIFLKEKLTKQIIVATILSIIGVFIIFNPSGAGSNLLGNLYGIGAGIAYAIYIITSKQLGKNHNSTVVTLGTFLTALVFIFLATFFYESPVSLTIPLITWVLIILFGAVNVSAYFLLNYGLKHVTASYGSLLLLLEPVSASVFAFLFYKETLTLSTMIGSLFIISSIVYISLTNKKNK